MKSLVVYSSLTGNTKKVGEAILEVLPEGTEICPVENAPAPDGYDFISVGFWVDRGTADKKAGDYLAAIKNKRVALFATLGTKPDSGHAAECLERAALLLDKSNTLAGTFICQGKIDPKLTETMKKLPKGHHHGWTPEREAVHEEASLHPDKKDLTDARAAFKDILTKLL